MYYVSSVHHIAIIDRRAVPVPAALFAHEHVVAEYRYVVSGSHQVERLAFLNIERIFELITCYVYCCIPDELDPDLVRLVKHDIWDRIRRRDESESDAFTEDRTCNALEVSGGAELRRQQDSARKDVRVRELPVDVDVRPHALCDVTVHEQDLGECFCIEPLHPIVSINADRRVQELLYPFVRDAVENLGIFFDMAFTHTVVPQRKEGFLPVVAPFADERTVSAVQDLEVPGFGFESADLFIRYVHICIVSNLEFV